MTVLSSRIVPFVVLIASLVASAAPRAAADRSVVTETIVSAPIADVWSAFTTKEGIESWMVPKCDIELKVGGSFRTSYLKTSTLDDEHTIRHEILAFDPPSMLAFRTVGKPKGAESLKTEGTWCVVRFEPIGERSTRVVLTGHGYGEGPEWDDTLAHFDKGNAWTMQQLQRRFRDPDAGKRADRVLELLGSLADGEWIHEGTRPDGAAFRVRQVVRPGPAPGTFLVRAWVGGDAGLFEHGCAQVWREPDTDVVRFLNVNERGAVARGEVRLAGDNELYWDWVQVGPDGERQEYDVKTVRGANDAYHFSVRPRHAAPADPPLVDIDYRHVDAAPPPFLKNAAAH